jgi:hypothetical protein
MVVSQNRRRPILCKSVQSGIGLVVRQHDVVMVTYQQLRAAQPGRFAAAADDWLKLAKEAEAAAEDIYERGGKQLKDHWEDDLGEMASKYCRKIGQDYQAAGMAIRGVVTTLDSLAESLELCKRNLDSAIDYATSAGLKVDENGKVSVPKDMTDAQAADKAKRAGWLIWDAVNDATKIDDEAAASLRRLIQPANITKLMTQDELSKAVVNHPVKEADQAGLRMMKDTMPLNADPRTQAAWWNSLTPKQRDEYMRAAPVELYDMKGVPADVKQQLTGNDGLNRIEMIRWAEKYGETDHSDVPGMNNCTNFVSHAMRDGGGLPEDTSGSGDNGQWEEHHVLGGPDLLESQNKYLHSAPWGAARNQHDYLLANGGETVTQQDARPGDIVYLKNGNEIHHSAIVTAVAPDGELLITQHNSEHTNVGLSHRLTGNEARTGQHDQVIVVRPHPNWD